VRDLVDTLRPKAMDTHLLESFLNQPYRVALSVRRLWLKTAIHQLNGAPSSETRTHGIG
jgi:hypothetical protein